MTMGFAELCGELKHMGCFSRHINIMSHSVLNSLYTGVDSTQLEMSLSTAWRHRRSEAEHLAATEISSFMEAVQESATRILVQFDEKDLEQDIDGPEFEVSISWWQKFTN